MIKVLFLSIAIHHNPESWKNFKYTIPDVHPIKRFSFKFQANINQDQLVDFIMDDFQNIDVVEVLEDMIRYKIKVQYSHKKYRIYFVEQANQIKLNSQNHAYTLGFKYVF